MDFLLQKICSFCSSNQLVMFERYLSDKKQNLSAKLIESLRKAPDKDIQYYCKVVYGNSNKDNQKKFNQLNHHTLQYFSFISQYFPSFLINGLNEIDTLLFKEDYDEIIIKINALYDVALKLEDFNTLISLCDRVEQYAYIAKNLSKKLNTSKKQDFIEASYVLENLLNQQTKLAKDSSSKKSELTKNDYNLFKTHFNSNYTSIKIIAKQSFLNIKSVFNEPSFYDKEILLLIKETKTLIDKHPYLLIARHREKLMSLDYMLVKHTRLTLSEKELKKNCNAIINRWQKFYHTNNQWDSGLMLALSIKGSYYITDYFAKPLSDKLEKELKEILHLLNDLENTVDWEKTNYLKLINFFNVKAMFLVLLNGERESIKIIERIFHNYQQKPFKTMYDGLFVVLMMAYYQAKDYDGVIESFSRYKKLSKSYVSVVENDLVIKAIYYCAQLHIKNKKQYTDKLNLVIKKLSKMDHMKSNLSLIKRIKQSIK